MNAEFKEMNPQHKKDLKNLMSRTFEGEKWFGVFLNDSHHGYEHGDQVRMSCLKIFDKLSKDERENVEGNHDDAKLATEIAALFHDCGRFNNQGEVLSEEQKSHHELSAKRAKIFCETNGFGNIFPLIEDAIISHDFQSEKLTPHLTPPKTMVGKILQSADQIGWFHPNSVYRTLEFNKAIGLPFYDPNIDLETRMNWLPGQRSDAVTVMLSQLHGPTGIDRFGIKSVRDKIETYREGLRENVIKIAEENGVKEEVCSLIEIIK